MYVASRSPYRLMNADYFRGLIISLAFVQTSCGLIRVGLKFESDSRWQGFFTQVTVTGKDLMVDSCGSNRIAPPILLGN